ncbi:MAG: thioredoxin domain-containing protein [Chthoniobacterales bacterium]
MKRFLPFIIVSVVALGAVIGATMLYRAKRPVALTIPESRAATDNSAMRMRGNPKAPVTLEEYGDYECPPCGKLAEPLKELEHQYGDKLRVVFHHYPLVVHAHSKDAAYAAEAAALQGKFWEMHDLLYREQAVWTKATDVPTLFAGYAGLLGLNVERFKKDVAGDEVKTRVASEQRDASKIGVTGTPTLFVNNHAVAITTGDTANLRAAIDAALPVKIDNH